MDEPTILDSKHQPTSAPEPTLFGKRYRPIALLGTGGMGSVYLTRDEELGELVAVKVLRPELVDDAAMVERFRDEVRIARRVSSPLVARTHDLAEHDGRWFVTMQYVEGETLSARLRREGRMTMADILPIARDVCDGLSAVHAAGVVHRDLKPGNVLLSKQGRAVLTDFGIALSADAALTKTDGSGTPTYTAPEQLAGEAVDPRADVFSLGAMLYVMATGERPFPNGRTGDEDAPDPKRVAPDTVDAFAAVVMRAMARNPRDRFPSSDAVKLSLEAAGPGRASARQTTLGTFVRTLGAGRARKLAIDVVEGVASTLGTAARSDLVSRLNARDHVRVVAERDEAEAVLGARLSMRAAALVLELKLHSAEDGYEFWRDTLEGQPATLPRMIERAAHAIERAFSPTSVPLREAESFPSHEVASLVLEARAEYRAFWAVHVKRSVDLFEQALVLAPNHPLVLAWCAAARSRFRFFDDTPREADRGRDRVLAETAVSLAPDLPEARIALAQAYIYDMRIVEAVPHFIEALKMAPGLVEQRSHFARMLFECGALEPALMLAETTFELDPSFSEPLDVLIRHHALRGDLDAAEEALERTPFVKNSFIQVGFARGCCIARDVARFDAHCARFDIETLDPQPRLVLEVIRALLHGDKSQVERLDHMSGNNVRRQAFFAQLRAECFGYARDHERCLLALDRAVALGLFDIQWFDRCQLLDGLRGTVRFELLRRTAHERAIEVLSTIDRCLEAK
jgi:eukaryotic-like serine/threonine-protein kinase